MNLDLIGNILAILSSVVFVYTMIRYARQRVWMNSGLPGKPFTEIGYLRQSVDGTASEAVLSSGGAKPLGRVVLSADGQSAKAHVLNSQMEDAHDDGDYRERGFITADGIIFRASKGEEPVAIGYTARASDPTTPTLRGERSWKSLWMKAELNAYLYPEPQADETEDENEDETEAETTENAEDKSNETQPAAPSAKLAPQMVAHCVMTGLPNQPQGAITNEARACAYATFHALCAKQSLREYYNPEAHGWRDVALLTTLIYTLVFMTLYFVNTCLLQMPLLGNDWTAVFILFAYYVVLWAAMRQIKIDKAENGNSIQSRLDLINKSLGMGWVDIIILICCGLAIYCTVKYYDFDFIPLIMGIMVGVASNRALRANSLPWKVQTSLREDDMDLDLTDTDEMMPPQGDIARTYDWDLDAAQAPRGMAPHGNIAIEFSTSLLAEMRMANPYYQMKADIPLMDSIRHMVDLMQKQPAYSERVAYVAHCIAREARRAHLTERQTLQFALDFAQSPNIEYVPDKQSAAISFAVKYVRFPDETLYDKEGDADCKSMLAAMIFHHMGYQTMIVASRRYKHTGVCVEPKTDELWDELATDATTSAGLLTYNRHRYVYCETTDDGFRLGGMVCVLTPSKMSRGPVGGSMAIDDFETKIEIETKY